MNRKLYLPPEGKELDLLCYLCNICINNCSLTTHEVTTRELNEHLKIKSTRLRNIVFRVTRKNLVKVLKQNCSNTGAYRIFKFNKAVYDKLLKKITTNKTLSEKYGPLATPSSDLRVCSSYINTTTT